MLQVKVLGKFEVQLIRKIGAKTTAAELTEAVEVCDGELLPGFYVE
jgi:hypothetical protein